MKLGGFKPQKDDYVARGEYTLKVLEVHRGGKLTIRNEFGYAERVSVDDVEPADPEKVAQIKRRLEAGRRRG